MPRLFDRRVQRRVGTSAAFGAVVALIGCGGGGPGNTAVAKVLTDTRDQARQQMIAIGGPASAAMLGPDKPITVSGTECTAGDNGVYKCTFTATMGGQQKTSTLLFKNVDGAWSIVNG